jgi:hypothetical protein
MPRPKSTLQSKINQCILKYPKSVGYVNGKLQCLVCYTDINFTFTHGNQTVSDHINSTGHRRKKEEKKEQPTIDLSVERQSEKVMRNPFFEELGKWLVENNIPLSKIDDPKFSFIFKKYSKQNTPSSANLRQYYIPNIYESIIEKIRNEIGEDPIYLIVDETSDKCNRNVLNVMVGHLNGKYSKPMLLMVTFLEVANSDNVSQAIMNALLILWKGQIYNERLWLILTDMGSYMMKAVEGLKKSNLFPKLKHVTCILHVLHNVCEKLRENNDLINELISKFQNIICKSNQRKKKFKQITKLPLPPKAVITRWGTWLLTAFYFAKNFAKVSEFIKDLDRRKCKAIELAQELINGQILLDLENQLIEITRYEFMPEIIDKLQTQGLSIDKQMELFSEVKSKIDGNALQKFIDLEAKTRDLKDFISQTNDYDYKKTIKFAPLVTVDVERSFSLYKRILSDNRMSMIETTIQYQNVIQFNHFLNAE